MSTALIAGAIQGLGGLLGGRSRNKAARQMRRDAITAADDQVAAARADQIRVAQLRASEQARAIEYRNADEARLREATGLDLEALRNDAVAAGFNPLTVLNATGGMGYDGRGAVLTTPFVSTEFIGEQDAFANRAGIFAGSGQAVVETSGYFGDALSQGASAFFDQLNAQTAFNLERARNAIYERDTINSAAGSAGPFGAQVTTFDAAPKKVRGSALTQAVYDGGIGDNSPVPVVTPSGIKWLDAGAARAARVRAFDTVIGETNEALLGELMSEVETSSGVGAGWLDNDARTGGPYVPAPQSMPPMSPSMGVPAPTWGQAFIDAFTYGIN